MLTYVFCGYGPECKPSRAPRNNYLWSMARVAADRLEAEFVLVGLLEEFRNFFRVLEVGRIRVGSEGHFFFCAVHRTRRSAKIESIIAKNCE